MKTIAEKYAEAVARATPAAACRHGHPGCATVEGWICSRELSENERRVREEHVLARFDRTRNGDGALAWKPLGSGRELTLYPLLLGASRLCEGRLAYPAYEKAWDFDTHEDGLAAFAAFVPGEHPAKFVRCLSGTGHWIRGERKEGGL